MSTALEYPAQYGAMPHRKPLPSAVTTYPSGVTGNDQIYTRQPSHSHTRSASSSVMPPGQYPIPQPQYPAYNPNVNVQPGTRRTLSNATSSTTSSGHAALPMNRAPTNNSYASSIRRSTSSRSQQQATTSYVALLRRQKATVWCDHAQHEDPRVLAQQRQAKMRANMQVVGGVNSASRTSTSSGGGVRSKIRHHGAVKASAYQAGNMSGAGVPMRLSASEVDDGDSDDDRLKNTRYHQRNGSERSSLSSGHRASGSFQAVVGNTTQPSLSLSTAGRLSASSTPPSRHSYSPGLNEQTTLRHGSNSGPEDTPVPADYQGHDYFARPSAGGPSTSGGSGSSSEERGFGDMGRLPVRVAKEDEAEKRRKTSEELRRRGSVDDRTMTMSGVRLFVANPDLSD
ncbi:hypothetical protein K461DRAFT_273975 [Myriangium duriaei CBS 260.36]|uniref:Uncharacterized protein n=1 Tax=Myriangium duriaei CBS 260.36 TaxID=1168546 RepID=A0A9P4JA18_9PEZI|nr:hypothetical protein K461DRAFT_273975 [Myriangium duriaei CBS 260.36]